MKRIFLIALLALSAATVHARKNNIDFAERVADYAHSVTDKAPATAQIETGFSPDGGSERLVLKIINASQRSLRLAAYSFTSPSVVRALLNAKKRGADVRVVVDEKGNRSKASLAALNLLVGAGIPVRTISTYAIHHDKFIVADELHTQTGSFNYSQAAAKKNSENVIVIWHNRTVAASYLEHWQNRFEQGMAYRLGY
ncbi:MAG: nuc [Burkholderiaceae bacterium]|nr:nuc [Burkholderiaceae bacterium]